MARCPFAEWIRSPNYDRGRSMGVSVIVQHSTVSDFASALTELTRADSSPVSAHFLIGLDGRIVQMVDTDDLAWHARQANSYSVGIEHVDNGWHQDPVRTPELYAASARLNRWLLDMYDLDVAAIRPHREYVNTACPSGLDLGLIIAMTRGEEPDMALTGEERNWIYESWVLAHQTKNILETHFRQNALSGAKRALVVGKSARAKSRAGHGKKEGVK